MYIIGSDAPTFAVSDGRTSKAVEEEEEEEEEDRVLGGARRESEEYFASEI